MALQSSRKGIRKESVDYLGNIIIDEKLKNDIVNSIDDVFINNEELSSVVNELNDKINGSVLTLDLLWTNANATTTFPAQLINLDLNNYPAIFIEFNYKTNEISVVTGFLFKTESNGQAIMDRYGDDIAYRDIVISKSNLSIGSAVKGINSTTLNNDYIIPARIYGVK